MIRDIVAGVEDGVVVEDYPDFPKGPCVLVIQQDHQGKPIHIVRGIPRQASTPAVVITVYRPDPAQWTGDFLRRRS